VIGFGVLLRKEVLEQVRTMRLLATGAVFLLAGLMSPLLARYSSELFEALVAGQAGGFTITMPSPTSAYAIDQTLKNVGQVGVLAAVLLTMGLVATEKERGTAAFVLTKPADRGAFLLAKFVAVALTLLVGMALGGAAAWAYTAMLFEPVPLGGWVAMCVLLWVSFLVYEAVTFLGSTLARSVLPAAGLGIAFLLVLGVLSGLPTIGPWMPASLTAPAAALALGKDPGNLLGPLATSLAAIVLAFLASWLLFRRQEL
jgi:ABC-2 type transport system permease protein